MPIHPTAIVDKTAEIDATAEIGAYAVVEKDVHIGAETRLYPHAYVSQGTTLGCRCQIHPFAVVGHPPQDVKFGGAPTYTQIGDETIIREHATIHRGTLPDSSTIVGQRCFIMTTAHIAHNCVVGNDVVMVNGALLAGHVHVGDRAFISGHASAHQFVRIGTLVMISGLTRITNDVPPYMLVGPDGVLGINTVGLRRAGLGTAERQELRDCHRILYRTEPSFARAIERVAKMVQTEPGRHLAEFLRGPSKRGYMRLKREHAANRDGEYEPTCES